MIDVPEGAHLMADGEVQPFLKWAGGKRWLVSKAAAFFPASFDKYFEPFVGGGAVFFALNPANSVLSDANKELIAAYRAVKSDWRAVLEGLQQHQQQHSRQYYYRIRNSRPSEMYERAARFIYLNRTCWNGLYRVNRAGKFNVPVGTKTSVILEDDDFESIARRLSKARLLHGDFERVIDQAQENDFVYADPPYTVNHSDNGFIKYNDRLFRWQDQLRLHCAAVRARERGVKVIISNACHPSILELYRTGFTTLEVERYSVISGKVCSRGLRSEYLILGVE